MEKEKFSGPGIDGSYCSCDREVATWELYLGTEVGDSGLNVKSFPEAPAFECLVLS